MRAWLLAGVVAFGWAGAADASFVVTFSQQGTSVEASGIGSIDTAGLSFVANYGAGDALIGAHPEGGYLLIGQTPAGPFAEYSGGSGFLAYGSGGPADGVLASTGNGSTVGISTEQDLLALPVDYVSESFLSSQAFFQNETLAGLGLTAGSVYTYHFGSGATADSFVIDIAPSTTIPEPGSLALLSLPLGAAGMLVTRRSRQQRRLAAS